MYYEWFLLHQPLLINISAVSSLLLNWHWPSGRARAFVISHKWKFREIHRSGAAELVIWWVFPDLPRGLYQLTPTHPRMLPHRGLYPGSEFFLEKWHLSCSCLHFFCYGGWVSFPTATDISFSGHITYSFFCWFVSSFQVIFLLFFVFNSHPLHCPGPRVWRPWWSFPPPCYEMLFKSPIEIKELKIIEFHCSHLD